MSISYFDLKRIHQPLRKEMYENFDAVFEREWFIQGKACNTFEKAFSQYCGAECIGTGNGLDALRLILQGLDIGQGDEVLVPANTFIATVLAITYIGAVPVLVDADPVTYNMDMRQAEEKITDRTKAMIVVHLYGRMADVTTAKAIAEKYHLYLLEDAAQAHGAAVSGIKAGAWGEAAAFSFYPGKNLGALGDGGAVVTRNHALAERVRALGNYGSHEKYIHEYQGCNSRLDELQAAFLQVKLPFLDSWNEERRKIARRYDKEIHNPVIVLPKPLEEANAEGNVYHIYPVLSPYRDALKMFLKERDIEAAIHYPIPIPEQKAYRKMGWDVQNYPVTARICAEELSLPIYPGLEEWEVTQIIDCINEFKI